MARPSTTVVGVNSGWKPIPLEIYVGSQAPGFDHEHCQANVLVLLEDEIRGVWFCFLYYYLVLLS
jgi:hypothetical protein